ncbi:MAG: hyalin [Chloroflexi bacterium]|nr:hyalin [Chloroflexota bacterium]
MKHNKCFFLLKIGIVLLILAGAVISLRSAQAADILFQVKDIYPGNFSSLLTTDRINLNGTLFFAADDGVNGFELWKSNGTAAGTTLVKDILPGSSGSYPYGSNPASLRNVNGSLFFTADDGVNGLELWRSDGTLVGTSLVKDIWPGSGSAFLITYTATEEELGKDNSSSSDSKIGVPIPQRIYDLVAVNGTLFFTASDGVNGFELWKSDGTSAGTVLVKDIYPGNLHSFPTHLTNVNGTLFFVANDGVYGPSLWKSNGTAAGTVLVKVVYFSCTFICDDSLTNINGVLFFAADDGINGLELWRSNGTAAGTVRVKDIWPGVNASSPENLTNVNGTLFFAADDGINGKELWKSDGTMAGTVLVKDIYPGNLHSFPYELTNVNGTLFFAAADGINGNELWKSDGTMAGTTLVKDIFSGESGSVPSRLTQVNETLFFTADDSIHGREIWQSDGTTAGTTRISDFDPPAIWDPWLLPRNLINVNGTLFFGADDGTSGLELWAVESQGLTLTNTVNPLNPSPGSQATYSLIIANHSSLSAVTTAHISDTLPAGVTLAGPVSLTPPQPEAILATSPLSLPTVASNVTIAANSQLVLTFPVTVSGSLPTGTIVINTATLTGAEVPDPAVGAAIAIVGGQGTFLPLILK